MSGPTKTQGEHTFAEDILISGEEIRGYSAAADLDRAEPVEVVGDYQVDSAPAGGGAFVGIVAYNVADGQEVAILGDDCEVRLEAAEAVDAGDALTPDGAGAFEVATDGDDAVAVANEDISPGEFGEAYISASKGNLGA